MQATLQALAGGVERTRDLQADKNVMQGCQREHVKGQAALRHVSIQCR
jgi:hypothetical protein